MKLVIFDLDGTLLNTIADLATATNVALEHYGLPTHKEDEYKFFVGNGINKLFERALPEDKRNEEYVMKIRSIFVPYYDAHNSDLSRPYQGINELLLDLQNAGIKIAVASNKYQAAAVKLVKEFFPDINFAEILGQRDGVPSKPDPTIVNEITEHTGISKKDTVYVGDSCVDMQTGKNADVTTVGVSWGFRPKAELKSYNPDFIADDAMMLHKYLLG
ncbi:HAD family hydrolase [uncultured Bacteroides sp.]|uniref:HAD family hydrolase n=1 Tax=uncultured Bacteroides sp. TaxID=162156 RepID=UPI00262DCE4F|nr:HAD family hydrolase [uncultured Bacteroides sp.]